jgi:phosphonate transport system substrate-binding protein
MIDLRAWLPCFTFCLLLPACQPANEPAEDLSDPAPRSDESLLFAVHPYDTPSVLVGRFQPLCDYLALRLGRPVQFYLGHSYADTIRRLSAGQVDLAYLGPTLYLRAHDHYLGVGVEPNIEILAGETVAGKSGFSSVLVALESGPIETAADLHGKTLAFGEPRSFSGYFVPRVMLHQAGVTLADLKDYAFLDRHERVALAVVHGDFAAGGLRKMVAERYLDRGLKIIGESKLLSPHVVVAKPGLDPTIAAAVSQALISPTPEGAAAFAALGPGIGFASIEDSAFDAVRRTVRAIESAKPAAGISW